MKHLEDIRKEFGIHFRDSEDELVWMLMDIMEMNMQYLALGLFLGAVITAFFLRFI